MLSYLVLTADRSRLVFITSLILFTETAVFKLTHFQDPYSLYRGVLLMIPHALLFAYFARREKTVRHFDRAKP